jgi:hypothetical protein
MKGRDRNAPCWCGSGKKFKHCHFDRDRQPKGNPWAAVEANRKAFATKKCCARDVGLGDCDGGVIKAHTVSRGPNLSKIAKDGHVLQYTANIVDLKKNGGKLSLKKIGIKDASVFYGFCSKHDQKLFSCVENEAFTGRPDQCLAVAYRTMSRELYGKDAGAHLRETLRDADKGKEPLQQLIFQQMLNDMERNNEAARREQKATHDALTTAMVDERYDILSSIIFKFAAPLPFMFAGAWSPLTDFNDQELQDGDLNGLLEQVFISTFADEFSAMICVSWRNIENAPGSLLAEQLMALPYDQRASACLMFVMKHSENVFFNPDWFQTLNEKQRARLDQLASYGIEPLGRARMAPIHLDIDLPLPKSVGSFNVET